MGHLARECKSCGLTLTKAAGRGRWPVLCPACRGIERRQRSGKSLPKRFVGADGEGVTLKRRFPIAVGQGWIRGRHEYRLLRVGDHILVKDRDLTTWECLEFLADLPAGKVIYTAYFFGYDVTMILRGLKVEDQARLVKENSSARGVGEGRGKRSFRKMLHVVEVTAPGGAVYELGYVPGKEFRVRRKGRETPYVVIQDAGSFFQAPFVVTLEKWETSTAEELEVIREGKAERAVVAEIDEKTVAYNAAEIVALEQLMTAFRDVCVDVGYVPAKWEGPGNLAAAILKTHGVPRRDELEIPEGLIRDAILGLHFGRFEHLWVGSIPGPVYGYDINSAYPDAMRRLPCLVHGEWRVSKAFPTREPFLAKGSFSHEAGVVACSLPVRRKDGSIYYPRTGSGAWWSPEILAGLARGLEWCGDEYWVYDTYCVCQPFDWVPALYEERLRLGKSAKGMVLKLGLNSLYGKMAQTKGEAPWFNPVWTGLLLSMVRAKLLRAIGGSGADVAMFATDALYTREPRRDLRLGRELGQWEESVYPDGLHVVQPGLYFGMADDAIPKTRGLPRVAVRAHRQDFLRAWADLVADGGWDFSSHRVSIPLTSFLGLRLAHHLGRPELAGQWVETSRSAGYDWRHKRASPLTDGSEGYVRTAPRVGNPLEPSVPYTPAFRDEIEEAATLEEWWRLQEAVDWGQDVYDVGQGAGW